MSSLDTSVDPKHYVRMFWRRKGVVLLCAVTVVCTAVVVLEFVPKEYESEVTLMIEERQQLSRQLESVMGDMRGPARGGYRLDEQRMDELMGRVRSRPFLERVVRLLRMHEDPRVIERAERALERHPDVSVEEMATRTVVGRLRRKISFESEGSGIYKIIVADFDPNNAQLLAKWISELFVDESIQSSLDQLRVAHEFGAEQLKIYEEQLVRSEQALERYQESQIEQNLAGNLVNNGNVAAAEALYDRVIDEAELARLRVLPFSRAVSEAGLEGAKDVILTDPQVLNQARGVAAALEGEVEDRLVAQMPQAGEWPPGGTYLSLRRGLFQLIERRIASTYPQEVGPARESLGRFVFSTLDHEAHADVAEFLGQAISDFKREAQSEPRGEMELAKLEGEVESNRDLLKSFRSQLIASDISQAMEMTDLGLKMEILDPPQVPLTPVRPDRMKILLAALLMGPMLGAGVAFVTELMDPTLRSISDFERVFSGPVLGTAPLLARVASSTGKIRKHWVPAALTGVVLLTVLFFFARATLLRDVVRVGEPVQTVDPGDASTP